MSPVRWITGTAYSGARLTSVHATRHTPLGEHGERAVCGVTVHAPRVVDQTRIDGAVRFCGICRALIAAAEASQPVTPPDPEPYGEDHWVDYGKPGGFICTCPIGHDHPRGSVTPRYTTCHVNVQSTRENQPHGSLPALDRAIAACRPLDGSSRLVSVVPAGGHVSSGVYLVVWEVDTSE